MNNTTQSQICYSEVYRAMKRIPQKVIKAIIGEPFYEIFQLANLLIINIGEGIKFSLHTNCFVRIIKGGHILLTTSDEFFAPDGSQLPPSDVYDEKLSNPNSLLTFNIKKVNKLLQKQRIQNIIQKQCGDLEIYFYNGTIIQILIDCLPMHDECYRLIEFLPCYDSNKSKHFVVYCNRGDICVKNE